MYIIYLSLDFDVLKLKSKQHPYEGVKLSLYELDPSDTLLIDNLDSSLRDKYIEFFFERHAGMTSILHLKRSDNKKRALIKFTSPEGKTVVHV